MSYRFFEADILTGPDRLSQAVAAAPSPEFSAFESLAVWLGMNDGPETLRVGWMARWLDTLLGIAPRRPLSDPHLESIRRLTVALRCGLSDRIAGELEAARRTGFSDAQLAALRARVRSRRPAP